MLLTESCTHLMFMGPCIVQHFYSKTNQMHNFSSLLNITLHVSDGLSVHHQESKTVHTASSMSYRFVDCLLATSQRTCMTYT